MRKAVGGDPAMVYRISPRVDQGERRDIRPIQSDNIVRKFGISTPQASIDLRVVLERWPNLMTYNKSTKRYERNGD